MNVSAIVLAAGESRRMQGMGDKVFLPLLGVPMVVHSLEVLQRERLVHDIVVVTSERLLPRMAALVDEYEMEKVTAVVPGGATRQDSVRSGLSAFPGCSDLILVHDGARPCVSADSLHQVILDGAHYGAAILAVPVKDTIKRVVNRVIVATPERSELWSAQTPQVFRSDLLISGHQLAREENFNSTDDAALVSRLGHEVHISEGSYTNIKITTPDDMAIAEAYLALRRNG